MVWVAIVFVLQAVTALAQDEEPPLEPVYTDTTPTSLPDLYREAKKMGLPMPPRGALLAGKGPPSLWVFRADFCEGQFQRFDLPMIEGVYHGVIGNIPITEYLGFVCHYNESDNKTKFLFGLEFFESKITDFKVWMIPPRPRDFEPFLPSWALENQNQPNQSQQNQAELLLALQCHSAGHGDLANLFFERVRSRATQPVLKYLHDVAWERAVDKLSDIRTDRRAILEELQGLQKAWPQWKTPIGEELLRDLEATVQEKGKSNGKFSHVFEKLLDISNRTNQEHILYTYSFNSNESGPGIIENYYNHNDIFKYGFDFIDELILHLNDKRTTRLVLGKNYNDKQQKDPLRVNEFCMVMILSFYQHPNQTPNENGESPGLLEFAKLLEGIGQVGEEKYLLDNVFSKQPGADPDPYPPYLLMLSRRYPHRLPDIYRKFITGQSPSQTDLMHDCLLQMDLPPDDKVRLLELGVQSPRPEVAWGALKCLALLDQAAFTKQWLAQVDKTGAVKTPENHPLVNPLGSLAMNSDDPKVWLRLRRLLQQADPNLRGRFLNAFYPARSDCPKNLWVRLYLDFLEDDSPWEEPVMPNQSAFVSLVEMQVRETVAHFLERVLPGDVIFPDTDQPIRVSDPRWPEYLKTVRARAQAYLAEP